MIASLIEALVHLFGRGAAFSCLFLFSLEIRMLSSESSLGIWTVGVDDLAKLWGGVDAMEGSMEEN